jgi:hypothetical protein
MALNVTSHKTDAVVAFIATAVNLGIAAISPYGRESFCFAVLASFAFIIGISYWKKAAR